MSRQIMARLPGPGPAAIRSVTKDLEENPPGFHPRHKIVFFQWVKPPPG